MESSVLEKILESLRQAATSSDPTADSASMLSGNPPPAEPPIMRGSDEPLPKGFWDQPDPAQTPITQMATSMGTSPAGSPNYMQGALDLPPQAPAQQPLVQPSSTPQKDASGPPDLGSVMQKASQSPSTDYSSYEGISADKRLALAKAILAKQQSGGNAAITGVAGLGDAIARSYGHDKEANATGDVQKIEEGQNQKALEGVDTERAQKLQDFQDHIEMSKQDPNSQMSKSMRGFLKAQGINVPSGMNAAIMEKVMGPMGELALKQATLAELHSFHGKSLGEKEEEIKAGKQKVKIEHPISTYFFGDEEDKPAQGNPYAAELERRKRSR